MYTYTYISIYIYVWAHDVSLSVACCSSKPCRKPTKMLLKLVELDGLLSYLAESGAPCFRLEFSIKIAALMCVGPAVRISAENMQG